MNLFLRIFSKRPDGYHEIASLFQAIDLVDRLFLEWGKGEDEITCTDVTLPTDGSNLICKALKAFRSHFPIGPVKIHIEKNIPVQAGLGGGSSNAATTLWALNEQTGRPATLQQLMEIGAAIGSDVPFFFTSGTAFGTGRGEVLQPFSLPQPLVGWLAKPLYGLSTARVYQHTHIGELPLRDPREALQNYPFFFNDLESAAFRLEPKLFAVYQALRQGFRQVVMTGSGTAFFCLDGAPISIDGVAFLPFRSVSRKSLWYSL